MYTSSRWIYGIIEFHKIHRFFLSRKIIILSDHIWTIVFNTNIVLCAIKLQKKNKEDKKQDLNHSREVITRDLITIIPYLLCKCAHSYIYIFLVECFLMEMMIICVSNFFAKKKIPNCFHIQFLRMNWWWGTFIETEQNEGIYSFFISDSTGELNEPYTQSKISIFLIHAKHFTGSCRSVFSRCAATNLYFLCFKKKNLF